MRELLGGKPFHGSEEIMRGKLTGATDSDYFYFFCPRCGDTQILRLLDYGFRVEQAPKFTKPYKLNPKPKREFVIAFELYCPECKLHDFVKVSNMGWQGGKLKKSPAYKLGKKRDDRQGRTII